MPQNGLPFDRPSKIVCVGLNYRDHAEESKMEIPERLLEAIRRLPAPRFDISV